MEILSFMVSYLLLCRLIQAALGDPVMDLSGWGYTAEGGAP